MLQGKLVGSRVYMLLRYLYTLNIQNRLFRLLFQIQNHLPVSKSTSGKNLDGLV